MTTLPAVLEKKKVEYMQAAYAENTLTAYTSDWKDFCSFRGSDRLPATQEEVLSYVMERAKTCRPGTIDRALAAIRKVHDLAEEVDPTKDPKFQLVLRGIRRTLTTRKRKATPLLMKLVKQWIDTLDNSPKSKRDKAIILLGLSLGLRRSELAALQVEDIQKDTDGLIVYIRSSKTDQEGQGEERGVVYGHNGYCPVRAVLDWLQTLSRDSGPLFSGFYKGGSVSHAGISGKLVDRLVKELVGVIGLDPKDYSAHSLRSGAATNYLLNGAEPYAVQWYLRWKSTDVFMSYVRIAERFGDTNPSRFLDR